MKKNSDLLLENYFSSRYENTLPQTQEHWDWVLETINYSFGTVISKLDKNSKILDAGCGVGYLEHYLIERNFSNIDACDISKEQIDVAKEILNNYIPNSKSKVKFFNSNIMEHLKNHKNYDLIAFIDFLEHLPKEDVIEVLKLSFNSLNQNGTIIFRVPNMEHPFRSSELLYRDFTHQTGFTRESAEQVLLAVGFKDIKVILAKWPELPTETNLKKLRQKIGNIYTSILFSILRLNPNLFTNTIVGCARKR